MSENTTNENPTNEYDSPWKEALDLYFPEFLHLLYPHVYQDIDWSQGYEFLDIELQKVVRDAELGKRLADKLVKVSKNNGEPTLCFVHIEVQGQYDRHFAQRMFVYNYRIYDRYEQPVNSFAILADENPQWRPQEFGYGDWVSYMGLRFQPLKLRDYRQQKEQLMASSNPFAVFILAYLAASETKNNYQQRFQQKWILVRGLYERGYTREQILELFRLIDWVLSLPEALAQEFDQQLTNYEEEQRMPYITS
ncbi:hypothetical protein, partial [Geitlerinema sp. PCC 9228]|uniref:hypothetical protein n=1 Tax=Geitlerinema sp. PCC 9228 TaxID=111611 RepID=UPI000A06F2A3